jgi:hypothetical protein
MRVAYTKLTYRTIEELIGRIDEPYRSACFEILNDHRALFEKARGSTHNHQTWEGGYIDHITDGMNFIVHLYEFMKSFGRRLPFSESDALLIFFLHDLEKPWRILVDALGHASNKAGLDSKAAYKAFREQKLEEYKIRLTPYLMNALTYIEGELGDYSSTQRVMNELSALCHMADTWCARGWYDYPKATGDEWTGATRVRVCTS